MATSSSGSTPADNLARGRQMAQDRQAEYDSIQNKQTAPGVGFSNIDAVNEQIIKDADERNVSEIEGQLKAIEAATSKLIQDLEEEATTIITPSEFTAKLREKDERTSLELARNNFNLKSALKEAVNMLKEYPGMRQQTTKITRLKHEVEFLKNRGDAKSDEVDGKIRELMDRMAEGEIAKKKLLEWEESILQETYDASSGTRLDLDRALQNIRNTKAQDVSLDEVEKASRNVRACLKGYPVGPKRLGIEIWLFATAHPMQFDCSMLLGLLAQGPLAADIAFLYSTIESYAIDDRLADLSLDTSLAIVNGCHWLLEMPRADKSTIKEWLKRLRLKLHSDEIVRFTLDWLDEFTPGGSDRFQAQTSRPGALLRKRDATHERRLEFAGGSELIRHGTGVLRVTLNQIEWLKEENFHIHLDEDLIASQGFKLVLERGEGENMETEMSTNSLDLSKLTKVLRNVKISGLD